jgi:hypothetical protein
MPSGTNTVKNKVREIMNECAAYAKQFSKSQRLKVYRECLKSKLKVIEQAG